MEPRIIFKPAFNVVGIPMEDQANNNDLECAWEKLAERYSEIPQADPDQGFGVHIFSDHGHRYLAGLAASKDGRLPEGMVEHSIGSNAYAVFAHGGDSKRLPEMVTAIFDDWLPQSGYRLAEEFYFEYYDDHFQPGSPDSVIFIFVPVVER